MTADQRREYSAMNIKQLKRYERKYLAKIFEALKGQVDVFIQDLKTVGPGAAQGRLGVVITNDSMSSTLQQLYIESSLFWGRKAYREIRRSIKKVQKEAFGFNEEWTQAIINYFAREMFVTVSRITETTRQQIYDLLTKALNEGWSIDQIVKQLQAPEMLLWRARLITRTELVKGTFAGRKLAQDQTEYETVKEWISANDHRVRHSHRAVDGEVIDITAKFQVQQEKGGVDMMEGPGDPKASIGNLANCRCSSSLRAKRDENGRLILKQNVLNQL